jgi:hypothetical protein
VGHWRCTEGNEALRAHHEGGDIISSWLMQLVVFMAVLGFLGYEFLSMATTALRLDGTADRIANVTADAYADGEDLEDATEAAELAADDEDVELIEVRVDDKVIFVTIRGAANTLVSHRIGPLERFTHPSVTRRERWRP